MLMQRDSSLLAELCQPPGDLPPQRSYAPIARQKSFGERVTKCLDEGAAAGLGPNERATYSRNCANR